MSAVTVLRPGQVEMNTATWSTPLHSWSIEREAILAQVRAELAEFLDKQGMELVNHPSIHKANTKAERKASGIVLLRVRYLYRAKAPDAQTQTDPENS